MTVSPPLLEPGVTCWRVGEASRAALLADGAAFMDAMQAAMERAEKSILLLGWDFDPLISMHPTGGEREETLGGLLRRLVERRPDLSVRILIWDVTLFYAWQRRIRPQKAYRHLPAEVDYRVDRELPPGASHHQKLLVVDDRVAFCGGADLTTDRWDTPAHLALDPRRRTNGVLYGPWHEVVMTVEGDVARVLGDLARERWCRATGERLAPTHVESSPWPPSLAAQLRGVKVGVCRTESTWQGRGEVREIEAMTERAIAAARRFIYIENHYFTSPVVGRALAERLRERDGPDVVLACPVRSGGYGDRLTMDSARDRIIAELRQVDVHGRFRVYAPFAAASVPIVVHSKLMAVDDRLLLVGSANLNNRSFGFDTECDLAIEAAAGEPNQRRGLAELPARLIAEHLGADSKAVTNALLRGDRLADVVDRFNRGTGRHLRPLQATAPGRFRRLIGAWHLFDPLGTGDNFRPWRRRGRVR